MMDTANPQADTSTTKPPTTSSMALIAIVLGIPGLCIFPLGIAALVLGIVALVRIADPNRELAGKGMAMAGTILGGLSIVLIPIIPILALLIGILLPAMGSARQAARNAVDASQLRQVAVVYMSYAQDHNNILPAHPRDTTGVYGLANAMVISPHHDPLTQVDRGDGDGTAVRYGSYVFINQGAELDAVAHPSSTIIAYTAIASDQQNVRVVLFMDGHVEMMDEQSFRAMMHPDVDIDAHDGP